jgi:flagellum-specific peptidoglycan hydrolase FlgJ
MSATREQQQRFIDAITPYAQEVQAKYSIPASIAIAQAALETGWGTKVAGNNFFGIKAGKSWLGATSATATHEYVDGVRTSMTDRFRAYDSLRASVENYGSLLARSTRYTEVVAADNAFEAADALQEAGYATDPKYAEKLKQIIESRNLTRFDDASHSGYLSADARFKQSRERLQQVRDSEPDVWKDILQAILGLTATMVASLGKLFSGDDGTPQVATLPTATPANRSASAERSLA